MEEDLRRDVLGGWPILGLHVAGRRLRLSAAFHLTAAEFRARTVGRVAVLTERLMSLGYERVGVSRLNDEAEAALAWIKERYPHLELQRFGPAARPDLLQRMINVRGRYRQFADSPEPEVWVIEFEDDQQAFEFKMYLARQFLNSSPAMARS